MSARSRQVAASTDNFAGISPAIAHETVRLHRVAAVRQALKVADLAFDRVDRHRHDGHMTGVREYVNALEALKEATETLVKEED